MKKSLFGQAILATASFLTAALAMTLVLVLPSRAAAGAAAFVSPARDPQG